MDNDDPRNHMWHGGFGFVCRITESFRRDVGDFLRCLVCTYPMQVKEQVEISAAYNLLDVAQCCYQLVGGFQCFSWFQSDWHVYLHLLGVEDVRTLTHVCQMGWSRQFFLLHVFPNHLTWWSCIPESNYQWLSNQRAYDFLRESLSPTVVKGICRLAHLLVPLNIGLSLQVLHTNPAGLISFCGSQPFLHRGVPAGQKHHGTSRPRQPPCRRGTPQRGPTALYLDESAFGCGILWPFCGNQKEYKDW